MSNLLEMPLVLAAMAFTAGYVLAKLGALLNRNEVTDGKTDPERDRRFRAMDAELRIIRKQLEEAQLETRALKEARGELQAELDERNGDLLEATGQLADLREQLQDECEKTQGLRSELSQRAEQGIRAQVQIRDMETELSLSQGSGAAVTEEISQLFEETSELEEELQRIKRERQSQLAKEHYNDSTPHRRLDDFVDGAESFEQDSDAGEESPHPMRRSTDRAVGS